MQIEKVSLYIPCYNAEKYIGECLEGVLKQTYPIDEILIIDDGSNDTTVSIVSKYPVRVIHHTKNMGLAASRNTAFKEAKNEFVAALDADCVPRPDWLENLMKNFIDDTIAGAGGMLVEKYIVNSADKWREVHMSQHWGNNIIEDPPFLNGCNTIFKKAAIEAIGLYNTFYRNNYEDVDISNRLSKVEYRLIYNPDAIVEHLRKDTIKSALKMFWHWNLYSHIKPNNNTPIRTIVAHVGKMVCYIELVMKAFQKDILLKNYYLLCIDLFLLFYYPWLELNWLIMYIRTEIK